jgi:hypothetical protein
MNPLSASRHNFSETKDFNAYAVGICYASVCTNLSVAEATKRLNEEHPTGIRPQWKLDDDPSFAGGKSNPCPCENNPETHRHLLFCC